MNEISKEYRSVDYECHNGKIAQVIIPRDATNDDVLALYEIFKVVMQRVYKIEV